MRDWGRPVIQTQATIVVAATSRLPDGGTDDPRRDRALRAMPWQDLTSLSPMEAACELLLPFPWLAASLAVAGWWQLYPLGPVIN
jgi:hypothetical protein